jgi:hypothetical protein
MGIWVSAVYVTDPVRNVRADFNSSGQTQEDVRAYLITLPRDDDLHYALDIIRPLRLISCLQEGDLALVH